MAWRCSLLQRNEMVSTKAAHWPLKDHKRGAELVEKIEDISDDETKPAQMHASKVLGPAQVSPGPFAKFVHNGKQPEGKKGKQAPEKTGQQVKPSAEVVNVPDSPLVVKRKRSVKEKYAELNSPGQDESPLVVKKKIPANDAKANRRRRVIMDEDDEDEVPLGQPSKSTSDTGSAEVSAAPREFSDRTFAEMMVEYAPADAGIKVEGTDALLAQYAEEDERARAELQEKGPKGPQKRAGGAGNKEEDPVLAALRKAKDIAAGLKDELQLPQSGERYSEVDPAAAKLVTQELVKAACFSGTEDALLKPYQLVGVNFLYLLYRKGEGGAILADEMGLGKTIQAITFLGILLHLEKNKGPHLVVAPASLLENWQRELKRWCSKLNVVLYHGNDRNELRFEYTRILDRGGTAPFNVLLTTYSIFERDSQVAKTDRIFLRKWPWVCVLMDEAHLLKDSSSTRTRKLRAVASAARFRLMLTGTPLQNDLQELWSLLEFLMPTVFEAGSDAVSEYLAAEKAADMDVQSSLITQIKGILAPFVLRRVKADVMRQLVPKDQKIERVAMVPPQAQLYRETVESYRATVTTISSSHASTSTSPERLLAKMPKRQVANIFAHLRKIANHPLLVRHLYSDKLIAKLASALHKLQAFGDSCSETRVLEELKSYSDFSIHQLCCTYLSSLGDHVLDNAHALASGKAKVLQKLLSELQRKGSRPLIFSQWTTVLDILEWVLDVLGYSYVRLDGSTDIKERQSLVDSYNSDKTIFAFLLSTRAGGQGLNLTGADTVILHDVDFNPQVDRQAEDRCHRIGQTKPVTVYRLVSLETVDEGILSIAQRKLVLDAAVLDSKAEKSGNDAETTTMGEILASILAPK